MKLENLRSEVHEGVSRVSATVHWEDCDRPSRDIYFETDVKHAQNLSCSPDAFLTACVLPAMRHGERRVTIDAEVCPELQNGLKTVMALLSSWYELERQAPQIEAKTTVTSHRQRSQEQVGLFLSGGIDSLAALRANRLSVPSSHPGSIKQCLIVHGFDMGGYEKFGRSENSEKAFSRAVDLMSEVAQAADVGLIPVYTNIRHLDDEVNFWRFEFHGAALAAVAHAFGGWLTTVVIGSTYDIPNLQPHGSHPLIDSNYSSHDLRIHHEGIALSRLAKTQLICDWDVALRNIRVCTRNRLDTLNCGHCEKCIRTMATLVALDKLDQTSAFPADDLSADLLATVKLGSQYQKACYEELIPLLEQQDRQDLVRVIKQFITRYAISQFDRKYLNGSLGGLKRLIAR